MQPNIMKRITRKIHSAFLAFAVLMLVHAAPAQAQDDKSEEAVREREALKVSDSKNLTLIVLGIESNTAKVTEDAVRTRTELRIRAAGLTPRSDESDHFLYVFVHIDGAAFNIDIGFYRAAFWKTPDGKTAQNFLETWNSGHTLGTHEDNAANVMNALDERLNQFLNAFLKANPAVK